MKDSFSNNQKTAASANANHAERVLTICKTDASHLERALDGILLGDEKQEVDLLTSESFGKLPANATNGRIRHLVMPTRKKSILKAISIAISIPFARYDKVVVVDPTHQAIDLRIKVLALLARLSGAEQAYEHDPNRLSIDTCIVCGIEARKTLWFKSGCKIVRCESCGMVYTANPPKQDDLKASYSRDYESFIAKADSIALGKSEQARYRLKIIESCAGENKGNILDIGCSFGFFLNEARKQGWNTWGVEISEPTFRYAKEVLGLNVYNQLLTEADLSSDSFDAVCLWDVLEHLLDPEEIIKESARLLKPGGLICLVVPNIDSMVAKACGKHWGWMIPPAHLSYFSPKTLTMFLEKHGFSIEMIRTEKGDSIDEIYLSGRGLLARVLGRVVKGLTGPVYEDTKISRYFSKFTGPVLKRIWAKNKGAEIVAIARKV